MKDIVDSGLIQIFYTDNSERKFYIKEIQKLRDNNNTHFLSEETIKAMILIWNSIIQ